MDGTMLSGANTVATLFQICVMVLVAPCAPPIAAVYRQSAATPLMGDVSESVLSSGWCITMLSWRGIGGGQPGVVVLVLDVVVAIGNTGSSLDMPPD